MQMEMFKILAEKTNKQINMYYQKFYTELSKEILWLLYIWGMNRRDLCEVFLVWSVVKWSGLRWSACDKDAVDIRVT